MSRHARCSQGGGDVRAIAFCVAEMRKAKAIRGWFCVAVALLALAIADPLTEWISNHGWFGPGNFTDHSNADVVPTLLIGLLFGALHLAARSHYAARASECELQRWLAAWVRVLDVGTVRRYLPRAFALQIAALWSAETLEQVVVTGHGFGGTVWLGAPILAALVVHATICAGVGFGAALAIRALATPALRITSLIVAFATIRFGDAPKTVFRRGLSSSARRIAAPLVCRIGERAPPFATA